MLVSMGKQSKRKVIMLETLNRKVSWRGLAVTLLLVLVVGLFLDLLSWRSAAMVNNAALIRLHLERSGK